MKRYKIAAIIIIIHSIIEIGGFFSVLPIWIFGIEASNFISFDPPTPDVAIAGLVWGTIRLTGGIGLLKNLKWGLALSVINCVIALALMMHLLPFGIMDGVLAGPALVLMLTQYFGKAKL